MKGKEIGIKKGKPQGKGLTVLLQPPSRDRRRDSILGVKMRVLRDRKIASCGGISSIPISCSGPTLIPLKSRSRKRPLVDARSVLAQIAVRNHGYKGTEGAKALSLSPSSVSILAENGENILGNQKHVAVKVEDVEL